MARTQIGTPGIADNSITTAKLDSTSGALIPIGGIIMWSGATAPTGWQLCNNTLITSGTLIGQYTPNLQDKFIVGAGSAYAVAATGGSADATLVSHSHTGTTGGHSDDHHHVFPGDDQLTFASNIPGTYPAPWVGASNGTFAYDATSRGSGGGRLWQTTGTSNNHTHDFTTSDAKNGVGTIIGASATNANLPPYYALAFIMRVI